MTIGLKLDRQLLRNYVKIGKQEMAILRLQNEWKFREENSEQWFPAEVPGCVHTDLLRNALIPDPFYRDNEKKLQWIEEKNWEYESRFYLTRDQFEQKNIDLIFKGLDTFADVYLNGRRILGANNMFREWRVQAKSFLHEGTNHLRVLFRSPRKEIEPYLRQLPYILPSAHDGQSGTSPYTRKAPYQFGWDWGPRFVTMGIWKPVFLETWEDIRISDVWIRQKSLSKKQAVLVAHIELEADSAGKFELALHSLEKAFRPVAKAVSLSSGKQVHTLTFEIDKPKFWWPNELGEPFLYTVGVTVKKNGQVLEQTTRRVGLRTIELRQKPDAWGKSFEFVVNGVPLFAKGANWIPADSFPSRVSEKKYRHLLQSARDAHMNMIRVWGGGIYEKDVFYNLCDEMGLLVWQDFMFACSFYPGESSFLENVRIEATEQVKRLRNHPSLALWCGNNEIEASWAEWGWNKGLPDEVWDNYLQLFHHLLPKVCKEFDPDRPYWPSSPSSNLEDTPSSMAKGDVHFWDVWHKGQPFETYQQVAPRFVSEYGFQSFPEMATVQSFSMPSDWKIDSPVMVAHQKDSGGNQRIYKYLKKYYKEPRDFFSFLYLSQVLQAQGIKMGAEHFRRLRPRCMGSLYWQLNDCWPVASWASLDYFGRWKALHYYARRFYHSPLVSPVDEEGMIRIFVVSDERESKKAQLQVELLSLGGALLWQTGKPIDIPAGSSAVYFEIDRRKLLEDKNPGDVLLASRLIQDGAVLSENALFFVPPRELALKEPKIKVDWFIRPEGFSLRLTSAYFAKDVFLSLEGKTGRFSDNFFDLIPGRPVEVSIQNEEEWTEAAIREKLRIQSLFDSF